MTDLAEEPSNLLDWATGLAGDPGLRARLAAEPRAVLDEQGFATIAPVDLHRALPLVAEAVAVRLGAEVDVSTLALAAPRLPGEDGVHALARYFGAMTGVVTVPPAEDPGTGPDPDGPAEDATDPDVPDTLDDPDPDDGSVPTSLPPETAMAPLRPDPAGPPVAVRDTPNAEDRTADRTEDRVEDGTGIDGVVDRELDADRAAGGGPGAATRVQTEARVPGDARPVALRADPPAVAAVTTVELADGEALDGIDPTDPVGEMTDVLEPTTTLADPTDGEQVPTPEPAADPAPAGAEAPSFGAGFPWGSEEVDPAFGTGTGTAEVAPELVPESVPGALGTTSPDEPDLSDLPEADDADATPSADLPADVDPADVDPDIDPVDEPVPDPT